MALRIAREKMYVPLPVGVGKVFEMYGRQSVSMPIEEIVLPTELLPFLWFGVKHRLRGLVVVENNLSPSELEMIIARFSECHGGKETLTAGMIESLHLCVPFSVQYNVRKCGEDCWIDMDDFKYLDFVLCWHNGRFLPSRNQQRLAAIKTLLAATGLQSTKI